MLATPNFVPWLEVFPGLRRVALLPEQVRFTDRRASPWSEGARRTGTEGSVPLHAPLDVASVEHFVRDLLLSDSALPLTQTADEVGTIVVNVRRGDYYSDPDIREQYGFDVGGYLRVAVARAVAQGGAPTSFTLVSDDLRWCRAELAWLEDIAPMRFPEERSASSDFATVARARRMIITNSTFSYWAAHVSNVVHEDNHPLVWAPRFFDRSQNGGRSWLLDERWSIVEELDGGWAEPAGR